MEELLAAFDALRAEHEGMDAAKFNHDGTYKGGINQVRRGGTAHPPTPLHPSPPPERTRSGAAHRERSRERVLKV